MNLENKPTGFNLGNISKIEIAPFYFFDSITNNKTDIENTKIVIKSSYNWQNIYFTPETAKYSSPSKPTPAGEIYTPTLIFRIPKIRRVIYQELNEFIGIKLVVKLTDGNGAVMLLGNKTEGLSLSFSKTAPGNVSAYNGTSITIKGTTTFPSLDVY